MNRRQGGARFQTAGSGDEPPVAWGNSDTADPRDRPPTGWWCPGVKLTATMRTAREIVTSLQPLPRRPGTLGPKAVGQRTALRPAPPRNDELYGYGFLSKRPRGDAQSPGRGVYGSGVWNTSAAFAPQGSGAGLLHVIKEWRIALIARIAWHKFGERMASLRAENGRMDGYPPTLCAPVTHPLRVPPTLIVTCANVANSENALNCGYDFLSKVATGDERSPPIYLPAEIKKRGPAGGCIPPL